MRLSQNLSAWPKTFWGIYYLAFNLRYCSTLFRATIKKRMFEHRWFELGPDLNRKKSVYCPIYINNSKLIFNLIKSPNVLRSFSLLYPKKSNPLPFARICSASKYGIVSFANNSRLMWSKKDAYFGILLKRTI